MSELVSMRLGWVRRLPIRFVQGDDGMLATSFHVLVDNQRRCEACNTALLCFTSFLGSDPLDDRISTICPICSGLREAIGREVALRSHLPISNTDIAMLELCFGPMSRWVDPYLN